MASYNEPPAFASASNDEQIPSSSAESFAFYNHSATTLNQNLPPNVDDKPLARQKRKRTSPEDQAILEAAYVRDPKPDKPARLKLVEEVALGEKEVQIWFQNRRQSSRRKSRPLLPHEVVEYQLSRAANVSRASAAPASSDEHVIDQSESVERLRPAPQHEDDPSQSLPSSLPSPTDDVTSSADAIAPPIADQPILSTSFSSFQSAITPQIGYLANRRNALIRQSSFEDDLSNNPFDSNILPDGNRRLRKSKSLVRISMTSEGNAEITTKDTSDPSPPRLGANASTQGALTVTPLAAPNFTTRRLQRSSSGRSRDSRAWEFWCDKEARSELGHAAEMDASGSATGAIGLLRSASGRSILGSMPSKRNVLLNRNATATHGPRRSKHSQGRSSLQRSRTSLGRLQTMPGDASQPSHERALQCKDLEFPNPLRIPGNESDKENWSPEGDDDNIRLFKKRKSGLPSADLTDDAVTSEVQAEAGLRKEIRRPNKQRGPSVDDKDSDSDLENVQAVHNKTVRKSASVSSEDDLDCIHGLLSLSQGNWR